MKEPKSSKPMTSSEIRATKKRLALIELLPKNEQGLVSAKQLSTVPTIEQLIEIEKLETKEQKSKSKLEEQQRKLKIKLLKKEHKERLNKQHKEILKVLELVNQEKQGKVLYWQTVVKQKEADLQKAYSDRKEAIAASNEKIRLVRAKLTEVNKLILLPNIVELELNNE